MKEGMGMGTERERERERTKRTLMNRRELDSCLVSYHNGKKTNHRG